MEILFHRNSMSVIAIFFGTSHENVKMCDDQSVHWNSDEKQNPIIIIFDYYGKNSM